ncbi:MAG: tRNA uridine-5-carboxymethylaminomethyl(34) synthesis enzyme MnmG [Candidatus Oxydemutatoraceae bacterium WSBS_2016_MAG_OTU14]
MSKIQEQWDVIVVGGGHAGVEAALASARVGASTLLLTHDIETIGQMSCNPAIGGLGKSHLVREIDALGGVMAEAADKAAIHVRTLNTRKGPAVQATRIQADRNLYRQAIRQAVDKQSNLQVMQQGVCDFIIQGDCIKGVVTELGEQYGALSVVLTAGTFLRGLIHVGNHSRGGGRAGSRPTNSLAQRLEELNLPIGRLKTGTPPRIDGKSIDFDKLEPQLSEEPRKYLSNQSKVSTKHLKNCYLTNTNLETHRIILENLHKSPMYNGNIQTQGPRYCPSIEDKITRFKDKISHRIFLEPEGLHTNEFYPNGISTSLPIEVQKIFVRTIKGLEEAHLTRPGYAIEYDYFDPRSLERSLQTRSIQGLFFAGQINGTTGYEEAAAQGLVAGINAARLVQKKPFWVPSREESYIGVLLDDLVTQGVSEPYRMFTSRVEYRLQLREDNADLRLTEKGYELGLVGPGQWHKVCEKRDAIAHAQKEIARLKITPEDARQYGIELAQTATGSDLLARFDCGFEGIMKMVTLPRGNMLASISKQVAEQIEIKARYHGYIKRQKEKIDKLKDQEHQTIPANFAYETVSGLSNELREKLSAVCPETIGQAGRIQGMTPTALMLILVHLKAKSHLKKAG